MIDIVAPPDMLYRYYLKIVACTLTVNDMHLMNVTNNYNNCQLQYPVDNYGVHDRWNQNNVNNNRNDGVTSTVLAATLWAEWVSKDKVYRSRDTERASHRLGPAIMSG